MEKIKKAITFDYITKANAKEHNPNWPKIPNNTYQISITGGSGSEQINALFNLIVTNQIKFIYILRIHMKKNSNC